jgi:hypothetical protein
MTNKNRNYEYYLFIKVESEEAGTPQMILPTHI